MMDLVTDFSSHRCFCFFWERNSGFLENGLDLVGDGFTTIQLDVED